MSASVPRQGQHDRECRHPEMFRDLERCGRCRWLASIDRTPPSAPSPSPGVTP